MPYMLILMALPIREKEIPISQRPELDHGFICF